MKLAILGTGKIVQEGALPALKNVPEIEVIAIYARQHSKSVAENLAKEYSIPKVVTEYAEILQDESVDFVYIGLVNSVHYEYAKQALLAGKNVIVEKPFAATAAEVKEISELALAKGLYVFEAVTSLHLPNFQTVKASLVKIGRIKMVTANYSQYSSRYDRYLQGEVLPAFDPAKFGGALTDINIYNINIIIALFGSPLNTRYIPNLGFNGVDTSGVLELRYQDFVAIAIGAKDSDSPSFFTIQGEKGWIRVIGTPNELKAVEVSVRSEHLVKRYELNKYDNRMIHEFKEFALTFAKRDYEKMKIGLKTSLTVLETVEKARLAVKLMPVDD